jgi:2-polyprenyl-3-methyl-5-hydroxy-6-metoxy-1,4-benzoquinol methylase
MMANVEKFWDRLATFWGKPSEEPERTDNKITTKTRPYLKATDSVLDYGCATGGVDFRLADAVKDIQGIDISAKMIAAAKQRAAMGRIGNVSFAQATIFDEGLARESFDVVLAFAILHLLEDGRNALRRISELLKPGGLLVSVTPCLRERGTLAMRSMMALVRLASGIGLIPYVKRYTIDELQRSMEVAGLANVATEELGHGTLEYFVVAKKT